MMVQYCSPAKSVMIRIFGIPDMPRERVERALGSGVIVDAQQGLVLTNHHVIDGADEVETSGNGADDVAAGRVEHRRIHDLTGVSVTTIGRVARFLSDEWIDEMAAAAADDAGLARATAGIHLPRLRGP